MKVKMNSGLIQKRISSLQSNFEAPDNKIYYERAKIAEQDQKPNRNQLITTFVECCNNYKNANKYFRQCLYFLECATLREDKALQRTISSTFKSNILPYVEDLQQVETAINRYNLSESDKSELLEAVDLMDTADRIINNHEQISKRFNIESLFSRGTNQFVNMESVLINCCNMMDTYDTDVSNKLALTLEEVFYQIDKNNLPCDRANVVQQIAEYFLHREANISEKDYRGLQHVLEASPMIDDEDKKNINYFCNSYDNSNHKLIRLLNQFKSNPNKSFEDLRQTVECLFAMCRPRDIADSMKTLLSYIRVHLISESDMFDISDIVNLVSNITNQIAGNLGEEGDSFTREDIQVCKDAFTSEINAVDLYCTSSNVLPSFHTRLFEYKRTLELAIDHLDDMLSYVTTSYNESVIAKIQKQYQTMEPVAFQEFKIFKFNNLITACMKIDKKLKEKGQKAIHKVINKAKNIKTKIFESADPVDTIMPYNCQSDIVISTIEFDNGEDNDQIHKAFSEFCKDINTSGILEEGYNCYYRVTDSVELHLNYAPKITITQEDNVNISSHMPNEDITRCVKVMEISENIDLLSSINIQKLIEKAETSELSQEQVVLFVETAMYTGGLIGENTVSNVMRRANQALKEQGCVGYGKLNRLLREKLEPVDNAPLPIVLESLQLISSILESEDEKKEINEKKKEEKKKNGVIDRIKSNIPKKDRKEEDQTQSDKEKKDPFAGINLNSLQLYVQGLRGKMKDMSNKEKEISRNLDTGFNRFSKAVKDTLISDRREAIIKGSVIPSFSKCVKLAIGAAGIAMINPAVALFTVIGGLAMSKKLTKQERLLLLDEIETELEVIDKEISLAESKNQIKRYRKLLTMKKNLQRQYQRIKYNVRVGKDILPGSTTGLKNRD